MAMVGLDRETLVAVLYVAPFDPAAYTATQLRRYAELVIADPGCEIGMLTEGLRQASQVGSVWLDAGRLRVCEAVADTVLSTGQQRATGASHGQAGVA
ncbi:hypothetical protein GCM10011609_49240 [Lentzea pudingi]|uniref:Uncharacterized protein n=2 Tax=Lentzea pudingi TaxID=1789439 RepID=A0ABQ2ICF6_9PSEU|nr:hypothetical protein GCM10011609_49240 [Lentzea pudingi]